MSTSSRVAHHHTGNNFLLSFSQYWTQKGAFCWNMRRAASVTFSSMMNNRFWCCQTEYAASSPFLVPRMLWINKTLLFKTSFNTHFNSGMCHLICICWNQCFAYKTVATLGNLLCFGALWWALDKLSLLLSQCLVCTMRITRLASFYRILRPTSCKY